MDCDASKWCAFIVSKEMKPEVFTGGDVYALGRHSVCDWTCCAALVGNPTPDHSCPHPRCCEWHAAPVGLRSFSSVMGESWGAASPGDGLRGAACIRNATTEASFIRVTPRSVDGRLVVSFALPFGPSPNGADYYTLDGSRRALSFAQASTGAASFDGGITTMDVGYHGRGAFTACSVSEHRLCGCSWPLDTVQAPCVDLNSNATLVAVKYGAGPDVLAHGLLMSLAWGVVVPAGATLPRFWRRQVPCCDRFGRWFRLHRGLQLSGVAMSLAGFAVIVAHVQRGKEGAHFNGTHQRVGLALVCMVVLQVLGGFMRPHKVEPEPESELVVGAEASAEEKKRGKDATLGADAALAAARRRRRMWRVGHTAAGVSMMGMSCFCVVSGANLSGRETPFFPLFFTGLFAVVIGIVVAALVPRFCPRRCAGRCNHERCRRGDGNIKGGAEGRGAAAPASFPAGTTTSKTSIKPAAVRPEEAVA